MKNILALTALALGLVGTTASAASLKYTTTAGYGSYAFYVASEGTAFDVITSTITPLAGVTFANPVTGTSGGTGPGGTRAPNDPGTFANRMLDRDPGDGDGGKGWAFASRTINATTYNYTAGPIPAVTIDTSTEPNGRLFLGQVQPIGTPSSGAIRPGHRFDVTLELILNGVLVQTLRGIPEPASFSLAGIAAIGGLAFRRRDRYRRFRNRQR